MIDVEKTWKNASAGLGRIELPLSNESLKCLKTIMEFSEWATCLSDVSPLSLRASRALSNGMRYLLSDQENCEPEFVEEINSLLAVYPDSWKPEREACLSAPMSAILDTVELFQNMHEGRINPTGVSVLPIKNRLGAYLIRKGYITEAQMADALRLQDPARRDGKRLGDLLQEQGIITRAQLDEAIEEQMLDSMS